MRIINEVVGDSVLDRGDCMALADYRKEKIMGKLVSNEDVKKEIGIVKIDKRDSVYD